MDLPSQRNRKPSMRSFGSDSGPAPAGMKYVLLVTTAGALVCSHERGMVALTRSGGVISIATMLITAPAVMNMSINAIHKTSHVITGSNIKCPPYPRSADSGRFPSPEQPETTSVSCGVEALVHALQWADEPAYASQAMILQLDQPGTPGR
jgi:hypothetical protein